MSLHVYSRYIFILIWTLSYGIPGSGNKGKNGGLATTGSEDHKNMTSLQEVTEDPETGDIKTATTSLVMSQTNQLPTTQTEVVSSLLMSSQDNQLSTIQTTQKSSPENNEGMHNYSQSTEDIKEMATSSTDQLPNFQEIMSQDNQLSTTQKAPENNEDMQKETVTTSTDQTTQEIISTSLISSQDNQLSSTQKVPEDNEHMHNKLQSTSEVVEAAESPAKTTADLARTTSPNNEKILRRTASTLMASHPSSSPITSVVMGASTAIGILLFLVITSLCTLTIVILKRKTKTVIQLSNTGVDQHSIAMRSSIPENHVHNSIESSDGYIGQNFLTNSQSYYLAPTESTEETFYEKDRVRNPFYSGLNEFETTLEDPPKYEAISDLNCQIIMNHDFNGQIVWTKSDEKNECCGSVSTTDGTLPPPIPPRAVDIESDQINMAIDNEDYKDTHDQVDSEYTLLGNFIGSLPRAASYLVLGKVSSKKNLTEDANTLSSGGATDSECEGVLVCDEAADNGTVTTAELKQHSKEKNSANGISISSAQVHPTTPHQEETDNVGDC